MGKKKLSPRDVNAYISSVEKCRDKVARREFSHFAGDSPYLLLFLIFLFLTRAALTSAVMLRQLMRVTESVNLLSLFFVFFFVGKQSEGEQGSFLAEKKDERCFEKNEGEEK